MSVHVQIVGHGPDLVLLHGWAMHGGVFADLLPSLTARYRVHLLDLPGHGRSEFNPTIGDLEQLAKWVKPHVPVGALLLGWSLGGLLALKLAQHHPLKAMVLISTTPRFVATQDWPQGMAQSVFAQFFANLQHNVHTTVKDFLALQVRGDGAAPSTLQALQQNLLDHPGDPRALTLGLNILRDADERAALPGIHVPALVISGEYDRITHPKAQDYLATHLPRAEAYQVKRAGHAPFISNPTTFLAEVHSFLGALDVAQAC